MTMELQSIGLILVLFCIAHLHEDLNAIKVNVRLIERPGYTRDFLEPSIVNLIGSLSANAIKNKVRITM
jgi:hypothetical protein